MNREALDHLPTEDLIALVLAQAAQIEALSKRVAELEARLGQPPKTPDNSSLPPSKGEKAMCRQRDDLFRFVTRRDVPYTNNASERALRPSVIFRKVTGCFRSVWGATTYANAASVIATGRLRGRTALQAIADALAKPVTPKLTPA